MELFQPTAETTVLDVGVTSDTTHAESNYFEQLYPFSAQITCVGTENGSHLAARYPGLKYKQVQQGQPLPFADNQFDVVFSNAVLEHTGNREWQATFLEEICRVGRGFFVTTPNRWFPFEHHTGLPLLHFLPPKVFRGLIQNTKYKYWANESNLNILTAGQLRRILPKQACAHVEIVQLMGLPANLIAYTTNVETRH